MTTPDAPPRLEQPDFTALLALIEEGHAHIIEHGYEMKDFEHYVYEEALTAVYGLAYWDWINDLPDNES